jgi:hypothetical protein
MAAAVGVNAKTARALPATAGRPLRPGDELAQPVRDPGRLSPAKIERPGAVPAELLADAVEARRGRADAGAGHLGDRAVGVALDADQVTALRNSLAKSAEGPRSAP